MTAPLLMEAAELVAPPGRPPRRPATRMAPRVFLADGREVFITLTCTKCRHTLPLRSFGLRRMGNGQIRSVPQCKNCRGGHRP